MVIMYVMCYKENYDNELTGAKRFRQVEIVQYRMKYHVKLKEATMNYNLYLSSNNVKILTYWDATVCFGVCGQEISKKKCPNLLRSSGKRGIWLPDALQTCLKVTT